MKANLETAQFMVKLRWCLYSEFSIEAKVTTHLKDKIRTYRISGMYQTQCSASFKNCQQYQKTATGEKKLKQ